MATVSVRDEVTELLQELIRVDTTNPHERQRRLTMPAQPDEINRPSEHHLDRLRLGRPTVEQGAQRHGTWNPGVRDAP